MPESMNPPYKRSEWRERRTKGRLTFVVIPGHGRSLYQWRLTVWFLALFGAVLLALLGWAGYIVARDATQRTDLARASEMRQANLQVAMDLAQGRDALLRIAALESRLRRMVNYKSEKALLKSGVVGGPTEEDVQRLSQTLEQAPEQAESDTRASVTALMQSAQEREQSVEQVLDYVQGLHTVMDSKPTAWPVHGWISSPFGKRVDPVSGRAGFHTGVDIANDSGTPVHCTADGKVSFAGWEGGYGKLVIVNHGHGFSTYYGHLSEIKTSAGARVHRGDVVGLMGATGNTTGPHVHYEIRVYGEPVNPVKYMQPDTQEP
ncbi:MAG TPA: M23 family metallopeptidase [bacterium]|nr:M23 family metallopeptidase [bacterium]